MEFVCNDGGRAAAGYKGNAGDCVCRSIAIAAGKTYQEVYSELNALLKEWKTPKGYPKGHKPSVRTGIPKPIYTWYLHTLGFKWVPTMQIGQGCRVHLTDDELPKGRLIVRLSKHLTAVIDGVIHDTYDPQRWTIIMENYVERVAARCVYGYFIQESH